MQAHCLAVKTAIHVIRSTLSSDLNVVLFSHNVTNLLVLFSLCLLNSKI